MPVQLSNDTAGGNANTPIGPDPIGTGGYYNNYGSQPQQNGPTEIPPSQEAPLDDPLLDKQRFQNRRRMAWLSLLAIFLVTGLMMFIVPIDRLDKLESVITWFYMAMSTVVATYMGATAYAYVATTNNRYNSTNRTGRGY